MVFLSDGSNNKQIRGVEWFPVEVPIWFSRSTNQSQFKTRKRERRGKCHFFHENLLLYYCRPAKRSERAQRSSSEYQRSRLGGKRRTAPHTFHRSVQNTCFSSYLLKKRQIRFVLGSFLLCVENMSWYLHSPGKKLNTTVLKPFFFLKFKAFVQNARDGRFLPRYNLAAIDPSLAQPSPA